MKSKLCDRLRIARENCKMTQRDIERVTGIPAGTYSTYERGVRDVNSDIIVKLAKCFGTTTDYLYGIENVSDNELSQKEIENIKKYRKLDDFGTKAVDDLLNNEYARCTAIEEPSECETIELPFSKLRASAGLGDYLFDENFEKIEVARTYESEQATFAIEVDGDSMEPEFSNGDIVLVKGTQCVEVGDIGIFIIDGEGYIKECGENELVSLNPDYPNIKPSEFADFRTVGKVLGKVE